MTKMAGKKKGQVYVHKLAVCESSNVGAGTRIWAFAHVLPGARIGCDCNICDHVFIENDVVVGDKVTIKSGVQLWNGVRLGNSVFVGPNATFTNDRFPRSKIQPQCFLETIVEEDASIGANATILPGLRIGRAAMIGAGAVVTKNVPANSVVCGNPAIIVGYRAKRLPRTIGGMVTGPDRGGDRASKLGVAGCELWPMPHFQDMRGDLAPIEFHKDLPFVPRRSFLVYGVPSNHVHGEHAHRRCVQFLVAARKSLSVLVDDGVSRIEVRLEGPSVGLYIPPMVWAVQYNFEIETVLLVFASNPYDASDYIREYESFRAAVRPPKAPAI